MAKVLISIPDALLERVDREAGQRGDTRSGFLQRAAQRELGWPEPGAFDAALERGRAALPGVGALQRPRHRGRRVDLAHVCDQACAGAARGAPETEDDLRVRVHQVDALGAQQALEVGRLAGDLAAERGRPVGVSCSRRSTASGPVNTSTPSPRS